MNPAALALAIAGGFAIGSIPFGVIVGRFFYHTDIRGSGSGNIGAANALRTFGKTGGAIVLLFDVLKGLVPTIVALRIDTGLGIAAAGAAILGHCFTPWLHFRGGKGVATAWGMLMALSWQAALVSILVWLGVVKVTRYSSVASMSACAVAPLSLWLFTRDPYETLFGVGTLLLIIWKHRENIVRLREGRENVVVLRRDALG